MSMKIAALALVATAGSAWAGISGVNVVGTDISSLQLSLGAVDGVWNGGEGTRSAQAQNGWDWGFVGTNSRIWVDEDWVAGNAVTLASTGASGLETPAQEIYLNKRTRNRSGFVWTGFQIVLTNAGGNINLLASPSASSFSSVSVTGNGTGTVTIDFSGGSVGLNSFETFLVDFDIPGGPSWQYTMIQTPIPTPGALALMGIGGLAAARRRR